MVVNVKFTLINNNTMNETELTREQINQAMDKSYKEAGHNAYYGNGFGAGVKFAEQHYKDSTEQLLKQRDELLEALEDNQGVLMGYSDTISLGRYFMNKELIESIKQ